MELEILAPQLLLGLSARLPTHPVHLLGTPRLQKDYMQSDATLLPFLRTYEPLSLDLHRAALRQRLELLRDQRKRLRCEEAMCQAFCDAADMALNATQRRAV